MDKSNTDNFNIYSNSDKKIWISTTAYRILFVFQALLKKNRNKKELLELISQNNLINKALSNDTIGATIKTLRTAGCVINRPLKENNYKYEIISTPFNLKISDEEFEILLELRNKFYLEADWQDVFFINDLYEKIFSMTKNDLFIQQEKDTRILNDINRNLLYKLTNHNVVGKKIRIKYISPQYGEEELDIVPKKVNFENGKLYLRCFNFKYNVNSIFHIVRIVDIVDFCIDEKFETENHYEVVYELSGSSIFDFEPADYEYVLEKSKGFIKIKAIVDNEFSFIQRLLQFGSDFKIESPDFLKEKILNIIIQVRKRYENDLNG